ncbi:Protein kinase domain-containing protein ppk32 [Coemansia spiralis]|nr:Protein kinase domain-containing protein ppk32 [Coemansia spiralis]
MDTYFGRLRGLASAAANAVQSKIGRDYEFKVGGAASGHSGLWTLYAAQRRATGQAATVWVFEKQRFFDSGLNRQLLDETARQRVVALLTAEAGQLARLRHPSVLRAVEPLEDTRATLMFVTEPVLASLADLIAAQHGGSSTKRADELELDDLAIQSGLLQVCSALQFLHGDARLVHGNLVPASILVDARGDWKLAGLGFACGPGTSAAYEHDYQMPAGTQPALDYQAPERALDGAVQPAGDLFALGCVAIAAYCGGSPIASNNDLGAYRREMARVERADPVAQVPDALAAAVRGLLARAPGQRASLAQFQGSAYFDNTLVAALRYLEALVEQPADQKTAFLRGLPRVLPQFPVRVLRRSVLPLLLAAASDRALLPLVLPAVFAIVPHLSAADFAAHTLPQLAPLLAVPDQPQAAAIVLEHLALLQEKCAVDVFATHVLPALYAALVSTHPPVQARALQAAPGVARAITARELREGLLPRVQHAYAKANLLEHKVQALECLHGLLPALDRTTIVDNIVPQLRRTKTREPAVVMAMLAMYEDLGTTHLDRHLVATEVLPTLWAQSVDDRLHAPQFDRFMHVIAKLSDRVQTEHRRHLGPGVDIQPALNGLASPARAAAGTVSDDHMSFEAIVRGQPSLRNPLTDPPAATPVAVGWEWDTPVAQPPAQKPQKPQTRVDVDLMDGADTSEDFGTFTSFIPPPKQPPAKQIPTKQTHTKQPAPTLRPPTGLQFGAAAAMPPPLVPAVSRPSQKHAGGKAADLGDFDPFA